MKHQLYSVAIFITTIIVFLIYIPGCSTNQIVMNEKGNAETQTATSLDTNWQVTFFHHTILSNASLVNLNGDTLSVMYQGMIKTFSVDSIIELRLVNRSKFWYRVQTGAEIGSVVGAVLAALIVNPYSSGQTPYSKTETQIIGRLIAAIFFALEGGVLGGCVGAGADFISAQDEVIDLSYVPSVQRPNFIRAFLVNNGISKPHVGF